MQVFGKHTTLQIGYPHGAERLARRPARAAGERSAWLELTESNRPTSDGASQVGAHRTTARTAALETSSGKICIHGRARQARLCPVALPSAQSRQLRNVYILDGYLEGFNNESNTLVYCANIMQMVIKKSYIT